MSRSSLFAKLLNKQLFGEFVKQMDPSIRITPDAYEQLNDEYEHEHWAPPPLSAVAYHGVCDRFPDVSRVLQG